MNFAQSSEIPTVDEIDVFYDDLRSDNDMVLRGGFMNSNPCARHQIGPINFLFRKSKVYSCPVTQKKFELDSDILK